MALLRFTGFSPVRVWRLGSLRHSNDKKRDAWLQRAQNLGRKD
jgi:hypothetical protein